MRIILLCFLAITIRLTSAPQPLEQICSPKNIQERIIDVEKGQLFCRIIGKGEPLVVIHGGPGLSQDYLLPHLQKLAKNHQVILYDQRGSGQSMGEIDSKVIQMSRFVDDLDQLRKTLGFAKISLIGHSFGGLLAMHYAISHPESIDKLILLSPSPSSSEDYALFRKELASRLMPHSEKLKDLQESKPFKEGDPRASEQFFKILFGSYFFKPEQVEELNLIASQQANINGSKTYAILNRDFLSQPYNLQADLQKLTCKTLIIHGEVDPIPLSTAQNTQRSIPNSKLVVLKNCGHFPYIEASERMFAAFDAFFKN